MQPVPATSAPSRTRSPPALRVTCTHGRRHVRDGGPAQLDRRLLQDLCPPARSALARTRLTAGEIIEQAIEIRFAGQPAAARRRDGPITVRVGGRQGKVPTFGMAVEAGDARAALEMADRLAPLAPRFVSGYLDTRHYAPEQVLPAFKALAERLDAPLALEIVVPEAADPTAVLQRIAAAARTAGANPASVAVTWAGDLDFVMPGTVFADSSPFDRLYTAARAAFPGILLGGGTLCLFHRAQSQAATLRFARLRHAIRPAQSCMPRTTAR